MTSIQNIGRNPASYSVKERLLNILVPLVFCVVPACGTSAQVLSLDKPAETSKATSLAPSTGASELPPKPNDEVIVLRAQLETMRQYDQRLLSTVYWSLTVVVALVLGLITIIGFLNLRVYERDKAALRQELVGLLDQQMSEFQRKFGKEVSDFQQNIKNILSENRESIKSLSRETAESLFNQLRGRVHGLERAIMELQFDLASKEAIDWKSKGVHANSLLQHLQMLRIAKECDWDWRVSKTLEDMQVSLKGIIAKGSQGLDADLGKSISEALGGLPNTYSIEIGIITSLMQKARS
jgi:hypothetical protein